MAITTGSQAERTDLNSRYTSFNSFLQAWQARGGTITILSIPNSTVIEDTDINALNNKLAQFSTDEYLNSKSTWWEYDSVNEGDLIEASNFTKIDSAISKFSNVQCRNKAYNSNTNLNDTCGKTCNGKSCSHDTCSQTCNGNSCSHGTCGQSCSGKSCSYGTCSNICVLECVIGYCYDKCSSYHGCNEWCYAYGPCQSDLCAKTCDYDTCSQNCNQSGHSHGTCGQTCNGKSCSHGTCGNTCNGKSCNHDTNTNICKLGQYIDIENAYTNA